MLSNQTSRVYCDALDMAYLVDELYDLAEASDGGLSDMCHGAALAVEILMSNRLGTASDFMAVFASRATSTPQRSGAWGAEVTD